MTKILFLCIHNSARSQMAEAYLKKFGGEKFFAERAGFEAGTLNPRFSLKNRLFSKNTCFLRKTTWNFSKYTRTRRKTTRNFSKNTCMQENTTWNFSKYTRTRRKTTWNFSKTTPMQGNTRWIFFLYTVVIYPHSSPS